MHHKFLYRFLVLLRGSWRNAVYVKCSDCVSTLSCTDLLLTTDDAGAPVVITVSMFQSLTGVIVDQEECAGVISKDVFLSLFHRWLLWNIPNGGCCIIPQLLEISLKE